MPEQPRTGPAGNPQVGELLLSKGYLGLLLIAGLVGIPVSLVAFGFVGLEHQLQHWIWESLPNAAGYDEAPWWWPLPTLLLAGLLTAPVIVYLPGRGGHVPVDGLGGPPTPPKAVPGVILAALACLPLGAALGPEAPLMAMGGGLALLAVTSARRASTPQLAPVLAAAGSSAAISTIFGNPLVAAVMMIEAAGLGGPQLVALILPCLLASGVGALVFTGFGTWTGLSIGALSLPQVPKAGAPDPGDFVWGIPMAILVTVVCVAGRRLGRVTKGFTDGQPPGRTIVRIVLCALAVAVCQIAYALTTGRSPVEDALSGQITLAELAADPAAWPTGALIALAVFKAAAWGFSLGSLRGGPIFPAILIGGAIGVACGPLPGLGTGPGLATGLAASAAAVTRLPVTSAVLAAALMGVDAPETMPLIIVSVVIAFITGEFLQRRRARADEAARARAGASPG